MPINYSDIDEVSALRDRLEALSVAKSALSVADSRLPLAVVMGPPQAAALPSDTADLTIDSTTGHAEWPLLVGFPPALRITLRDALVAWLDLEMTATKAALVDLGADVTGAPA